MSCTLLFSSTTIDHAITQQRQPGCRRTWRSRAPAPGLPPRHWPPCAATRGVESAVALTPTMLGPALGVSDDVIPAAILDGGAGRRPRRRRHAGSLAGLHGDAIALGRNARDAAHAHVGERVPSRSATEPRHSATVVAIYTRGLGFGDALVAPELVAGHQSSPLLHTILVRASNHGRQRPRLRIARVALPGTARRHQATLASADDADRETNRWLGPLFVAIIFAFTSIAVVNTLVMIALRRGRELALLRLTGATTRQVRSMARWEAALIVAIGLGVGLVIAATALVPLSHALTGDLRPYIPFRQLAAILGISTLLAVIALAIPTRRALRKRPITALASAE